MYGQLYVLYSNTIIYVCRAKLLEDRARGSKISFIDPSIPSQGCIDQDGERPVEDYIIYVMENSKEKELILWPYHK